MKSLTNNPKPYRRSRVNTYCIIACYWLKPTLTPFFSNLQESSQSSAAAVVSVLFSYRPLSLSCQPIRIEYFSGEPIRGWENVCKWRVSVGGGVEDTALCNLTKRGGINIYTLHSTVFDGEHQHSFTVQILHNNI